MRSRVLTCLIFLLPVVCLAQASTETPMASLPKEPAEIFKAAAPLYDFSSPLLKPWHMKVSYQLYDEKGQPTVQGTYEYWWASPDTYRSTWLRPGVEQTDWHLAGEHSYADSGESLGFLERKLQPSLLTPLPNAKDLDPGKIRFDRQESKLGGVKLPCVMVILKMPLHGQAQAVPMGEFPTYCFAPDRPMLRAYYAIGATAVVYNKVAEMQGMYLPRELVIFDGSIRQLSATVDVIDGLSPSAPELIPPPQTSKLHGPLKVMISGGVAQGELLKRSPPIYPQDAKDAHLQGRVTLQVLIGRDGHIHDLSVISGPSPSLIASAMQAVSRWEYKPYMLHGSPVEVETIVNVVFQLSN